MAKILPVVITTALIAVGGSRVAAQIGVAFPNVPDVPSATSELKSKAVPDECWAGIYDVNPDPNGTPYPKFPQFTKPTAANNNCLTLVPPPTVPGQHPRPPQSKVNQGYIWGLTETATDVWYGTFGNPQCVTMAGVVGGNPAPFATDSYVCEFGASPYYPSPLTSPLIGDFRPPRAYAWNKAAQVETEMTPKKPGAPGVGFTTATNPDGVLPIFNNARGLRSATTVGTLIILAGPTVDGRGISMFAWRAADRVFLGGRTLWGYSNIRNFALVNNVLYAGVGKNECVPTPPATSCNVLQPAGWTTNVIGGRVLRLTIAPSATCNFATFTPNNPPPAPPTANTTQNPWSIAQNPCFTAVQTEVGNLDAVGASLTGHTDGRIYVTTWPEQDIAGTVASLYRSPAVPAGGLTTAEANSWTKVWTADQYEPDPVLAKTYGGGAIASYDGYLFWGSMHIPWQGFGAWLGVYCPGQTNDPVPAPCAEEVIKQGFAATVRAAAIFRGRNFDTTPEIDLLYGDENLPVFDGTSMTWSMQPNKMGQTSLWGPSGFGNPFNNYTWAMRVWDQKLWLGTMDWGFLSQQGAELINDAGGAIPMGFYDYLKFGADLLFFPGAKSPAVVESTLGIGNKMSYGVRTLTATGQDMFAGMANPMNLLTDPSDPHGFGGLGGWELIKVSKHSSPNTPVGQQVPVLLNGDVMVTFCEVTRAGHTTAQYIPALNPFSPPPPFFERFDLDGAPLPEIAGALPTQWLFINSSANWQDGCTTPPVVAQAQVCAPIPGGMTSPRMFELNWKGSNYRWDDITTTPTANKVCGNVSDGSLGAFAVVELQMALTLSPPSNIGVPGTSHTVTATVQSLAAAPLANVSVDFTIPTGPNVGKTATVLTNASGQASFTYQDTSVGPYPQTDDIQAAAGGTTRTASQVWVLFCDADSDKDIDTADLNIIKLANGKPKTSQYDPRDGNRDGLINPNDVKYCQLRLGKTTN
jgi:hypothetical protein